MTKIISRPYAGEEDLQSITALLAAVRDAKVISRYPGAADLEEMLSLQAVKENTRLWWDADGDLAAFAIVDHYQNLWYESRRGEATNQIEGEIIDWGVCCIRKFMAPSGEEASLDAGCRDEDAARIELLEAHGFIKQDITTLHMAQALTGSMPAPQLPEGFVLRTVAGEGEVEDLVRLHRCAFGTEHLTVEERQAMIRMQDYDPELDLLVTAPDGRMAAYCLCSIDDGENRISGRKTGSVDTIAVHPDFRGLGLAKALLLAGMVKLSQRGVEWAVMGTSSENQAMQRTALAAGFHVQATTFWYSLPVRGD